MEDNIAEIEKSYKFISNNGRNLLNITMSTNKLYTNKVIATFISDEALNYRFSNLVAVSTFCVKNDGIKNDYIINYRSLTYNMLLAMIYAINLRGEKINTITSMGIGRSEPDIKIHIKIDWENSKISIDCPVETGKLIELAIDYNKENIYKTHYIDVIKVVEPIINSKLIELVVDKSIGIEEVSKVRSNDTNYTIMETVEGSVVIWVDGTIYVNHTSENKCEVMKLINKLNDTFKCLIINRDIRMI